MQSTAKESRARSPKAWGTAPSRLDHGSQLFDRTRLVVTQARQCSAFPRTLAVRGFRCCRVRRIGEWRGELTLSPPERRAQEGAQDEQLYERKQKGEYDGPRQLAGEEPSAKGDHHPCAEGQLRQVSASARCHKWGLTFDMSGGPKGAERPLERPLDGGVRPQPTAAMLALHRRRT
jgi:hypothetical protein